MADWTQDLIPIEEARTLDGLFLRRIHRSPERVAYRAHDRRSEQWRSLTWGEMAEEVARWRAALAAEPGLSAGDRVAVLLRNCPEWIMFEQAALSLGLITVPLYTDDRADNAAFILRDAAVKVLLVQDLGRWHRLAEALGEAPGLKRVIILDAKDDAQGVIDPDGWVMTATHWLPATASPWDPRPGDPHDLATIAYTSGTTGRPKGVMLSHPGHEASRRAIRLQGQGDSVMRQFPGGQAGALEPGTRLVGEDSGDFTRGEGLADNTQGRAMAARGQSPGIAVGDDAGGPLDQGRAQLAQAPIGGYILGVDGQGLRQQRRRRIARAEPLQPAGHARQGPEEVDGGGARCRQIRQVGPDQGPPGGALLGKSIPGRQDDAIGGGNADGRRAAHHHIGDGPRRGLGCA